MSDLFIIQDPYHPYAKRLIQVLTQAHGMRPVFVFTNAKERYYLARGAYSLDDERPAATYEADLRDLRGLAARIRRDLGSIAAIIPFAENTMDTAIELVRHLEIPWVAPEVLARFRNKVRFKDELRRVRPDLWLGDYTQVSRADDLPARLERRTVLKPLDGFGSRAVHVFPEGTRRERVAAALGATPGVRYMAEEYLSGPLYAVDGFVDADGGVRLVSVFTSERISRNGSDVVYGDGDLVHRDAPVFSSIERYACDVVRASGLVRSPFHLEVIVDDRGPCLIDAGARLIGHEHAQTCALPHGGSFDFFRVAARGYVDARPIGDLGLDFTTYARSDVRKVYGVSEERGLIAQLEGVREVEAMSEFRGWRIKPEIGACLAPTVDLFTVPYSLVLAGERGAALAAQAARARALLRWNRAPSAGQRALARSREVTRRVRLKLGWYGRLLGASDRR